MWLGHVAICVPSLRIEYEVEVTPESAGWGYSSLRIISPAMRPVSIASPHDGRRDHRGAVERWPSTVAVDDVALRSRRPGECVRRTDRRRLHRHRTVVTLPRATAADSRCAAPGADRRSRCVTSASTNVPVELRGAGQSSRQVRNFGTRTRSRATISSPAK